MILSFLGSLLCMSLVVVSLPFFEIQSRKMRNLNTADLGNARVAKNIHFSLNRIHQYNQALKGLYVACQAAKLNPAALAAVKAQGEALRIMQLAEYKIIEAHILKQLHQLQIVKFNSLKRMPSTACALPGLLVPLQNRILTSFGSNNSGFAIDYENLLGGPEWRFWHPKVFTL